MRESMVDRIRRKMRHAAEAGENLVELAVELAEEARERTLEEAAAKMTELAIQRGHRRSVTVAMFVAWTKERLGLPEEPKEGIERLLDELYGWANTPEARRCLGLTRRAHNNALVTARADGRREVLADLVDEIILHVDDGQHAGNCYMELIESIQQRAADAGVKIEEEST